MSIVYTIKEHISSTFDKTPSIRLGIVNTLISIGSEMLLGRAHVLDLSLTSNGKTYTFSGKEINHTYHQIVRATHNSDDIELTMLYVSSRCNDYIINAINEVSNKYPEDAADIFYSRYCEIDSEPGAGELYALGMKNGKLYNGDITAEPYSEIYDANWESADTAIAFEEDINDSLDLEVIKKCAKELTKLNADLEFEINSTTALLYLNYIQLYTVEKIEKFIDICKNLQKATGGACSFLASFVDYSAKTPSIMNLEFNENDECIIKIISI